VSKHVTESRKFVGEVIFLISVVAANMHISAQLVPLTKTLQPNPFGCFWLHLYTFIIIILLLFILTANGFLPGGSGITIRHNTQITPHSNKTQHTKLHIQ
jgi:hypothetical protein